MKRWIPGLVGQTQVKTPDSRIDDRGPGMGVESTSTDVSRRDMGDEARNKKDWPEAVRYYELHLQSAPGDAAIWVQLGHARKESGNPHGAEVSYKTALSLTPKDADLLVQLGHLMKLEGRKREATDFYGKALLLEPSSNAYRELVALGGTGVADRLLERLTLSGKEPVLYLQINDLLHFLRVHKTPSGIQRVQIGVIRYALSGKQTGAFRRVEFVFNNIDDTRIWKVSNVSLRDMIEYIDGVDIDQATLRSSIDEFMNSAVLVKPGPHDSFVIIGAFWGMPGNTLLMSSLKASGASLGIYLYDLIPITYPEYCDHQLAVDFNRDLREALYFIDFALTISDYTAHEVRNFIESNGYGKIPVETVALAHSLTDADVVIPVEDDAEAGWTEAIEELRDVEFVMCVCTIEPRKNHKYLYDAWKILKQEGLAVPKLVFVGRKGWRMDDFFAQLENSNYLDESIVVVHDLSDLELSTLYSACKFTVFPSIVEGWGLPLGESLSYGKLCVASSSSSMPEVGGSLVEYIDPLNLRAGIDTFRQLITNPGKLKVWEQKIAENFKPRSWGDVSQDLIAATSRLHSNRPANVTSPVAVLQQGSTLKIGDLTRTAKVPVGWQFADLSRLALSDGWYAPEAFGAWMKDSSSSIRFSTRLAAGKSVIVYCRLVGASNAGGVIVTISGSVPKPEEVALSADRAQIVRLKAVTGAGGIIKLNLQAAGYYDRQRHLPRIFCVGLTSIAFVDASDAIARAEFLEQLLIDRASDLQV